MLCNKRQAQATLLLLKRRKTKIIYISKRKYDLQRERNGQRKRCFLLSVLPTLPESTLSSTSNCFFAQNQNPQHPKWKLVLSVTFSKGSTENPLVLYMAIGWLGITDLCLYIRLRFPDCPSRSVSNCI